MIDRDSPIPLYYQLKTFLRQKIEDGELQPGDRLPTEQTLGKRHQISRTPIRQALSELAQEGYIYRQPGRGTFVAEPPTETEAWDTLHFLAYDVRWVALMERAVRRWNELHAEREVELDVTMPSQAEFHQVLCASVGSGQIPDVVSIDYVWVARYARLGFLAPLDELTPEFAQWLVTAFEAPVLRNNTLEGHLYGVPVQADVTGLWYRRDWFEAEGVAPPRTWDEWLQVMTYFDQESVKQRWGYRCPISFPVSTTTGEATVNLLLPLVWNAGGTLIDAQGRLTLKDPALVRVLKLLQAIVREHDYLPADVISFHWWDSPRMLAQGEVPMILGGTYEWPTIAEAAEWEEPEISRRLGFVSAPRPKLEAEPVASLGGTTWAVMRESPQHALSVEILRLAMEPETALAFSQNEHQISPLKSVNQQLLEQGDPWLREVVPLLKWARPRPMLEEYVQISRFLQKLFESVLVDGVPVEAAVSQTARTLDLLLGR